MRALLLVGVLIQIVGLGGVVVVLCIVLFFAGVFRPGRSKRMQSVVDRLSMKGEEKSDRRAGPFGDATESSLKTARKAADKSAEKGRETHAKLTE